MGRLEPADGLEESNEGQDRDHEHDHDGDDHHEERKKKKTPKPHEDDVTICAPQLLHLDIDGRPLWFNGWLYQNKYAGRNRVGGRFDYFLKEPREVLEPGAWQLKQGNVCCLSNRQPFEFSQEERNTLEMLIDFARKAGSYVDSNP